MFICAASVDPTAHPPSISFSRGDQGGGGISIRPRFLFKSHIASKRTDQPLYGCHLCISAGKTTSEGDATAFLSQAGLVAHLARHSGANTPLFSYPPHMISRVIRGVRVAVVRAGEQQQQRQVEEDGRGGAPEMDKRTDHSLPNGAGTTYADDYDLLFFFFAGQPPPLVGHDMGANQGTGPRAQNLPVAIATETVRHASSSSSSSSSSGGKSPPGLMDAQHRRGGHDSQQQQQILQFATGAKIVGVEFPSEYGGKWAVGWADGVFGVFPSDAARLVPPGYPTSSLLFEKGAGAGGESMRVTTPELWLMGRGNSGLCATARWRWQPPKGGREKGRRDSREKGRRWEREGSWSSGGSGGSGGGSGHGGSLLPAPPWLKFERGEVVRGITCEFFLLFFLSGLFVCW